MKIERFEESKNEYVCYIYDMTYFGTVALYTDCDILEDKNIEYLLFYEETKKDYMYDFNLYAFCYSEQDADTAEKYAKITYYNTLHDEIKVKELKKSLMDDFGDKYIKKDDIKLLISSKKFNI